MEKLAPVALFVYNRPDHTRQTLEALSSNLLADQTNLFVFIDGPKVGTDMNTIKLINETKQIVNSRKWCKEQHIIERETNLGLAESIIQGVTKLVSQFGSIIVLEDDLVSSKYFLSFMNNALKIFEFEEKVACISGYNYPVKDKLPDTFFIKGADCWGWATWKRAWEDFEPDGQKLVLKIQKMKRESEFDFDNSFPYFQMLLDQISNKNNSWAIRWYASTFLKDKLCLYPRLSLIRNIGLDGSGTHSGSGLDFMNAEVFEAHDISISCTMFIEEDKASKLILANYFRNNFTMRPVGIFQRMKNLILNSIKKYI